ncbi:GAK8 protein, partial [Sylvia atricapilla]|nr:GAK8 protein [Sylvia atricapilla]
MDRQAAYDLFTAFLRRRGIKGLDLDKDLRLLLTHAETHGFFKDPHSVHHLSEWRAYGDKLWDLVLDDDKPAKKMSKYWKIVQNELLMVQAEKRAAENARAAQDINRNYDPSAPNPPCPSYGGHPSSRSLLFLLLLLLLPRPPPVPPAPTAPPLPPSLPSQPQLLDAPSRSPLATEPFPGALSDLAEAMARERREAWAALAKHGLENGDLTMAEATQSQVPPLMAFPVIFHPRGGGGQRAEITQVDWKLLAQLRSTVAQFGVTSEPAKQMLDYLFNSAVLLPADIKGIARLIYTPHQRLTFDTRWGEEAAASVALPRPQGDPLQGVTLDELLGTGSRIRVEDQAAMGSDKLREAMRVAKRAMDKIREPGGPPMYMAIKQGRDETLGAFVDKLMQALSKAGIAEHMQDALLKQCIIQNGNHTTRSLIATAPGNWNVQDLLDKAMTMPVGSQVFMVEALNKIGEGLAAQSQVQNQVLAALAPLQAAVAQNRAAPPNARMKCFRCGKPGHVRRECQAPGVWCKLCQSSTHNASACRRRQGPGNFKDSARTSRARTQVVAQTAPASPLQQLAASDTTWQQQ